MRCRECGKTLKKDYMVNMIGRVDHYNRVEFCPNPKCVLGGVITILCVKNSDISPKTARTIYDRLLELENKVKKLEEIKPSERKENE